MAKSLDDFFKKESRLVNLDWLDIDPKDYENLPFNDIPPYIAIPKLEEAWMATEDKNTSLVPNVDMDFNYKTPDKSKKDIEELLKYTKKQMMQGKNGKDLVEMIKEKSNPELIKKAYSLLKELSQEQGLLGNVYVDPTVFARCEEGAEFVSKKAKTAKYVKEMPKCPDCFYNKKGRCEVYKKYIASQIKYDAELLDFYSKHFSNLTGNKVVVSSKNDLQKQFLFKSKQELKVAEFKPNLIEKESSLKDVEKKYQEQLEDLKDQLSEVKKEEVRKTISALLIKGYSSRSIKDYIKTKYSSKEFNESKDAFNTILSYQGSLGKLYVDADNLPINPMNQKETEDFLRKDIPKVKYVIVDPQGSFGKGPHANKFKELCKRHNKKVVDSLRNIPKISWEEEFNSYPTEIKNKISKFFEGDFVKGLRLAFIQKELSNTNFKVPKIDNFELKANLDSQDYISKTKTTIYFTPSKIAHALNTGYTLSNIIITAKNLGVSIEDISANIKKAFEKISELKKYQFDVNLPLPSNIKLVMSPKDINAGLQKKPLDSSKSPIENPVKDFDLKRDTLNTSDVKDKKSETEIEIKEANKFDI